jgi:hypothetical protein
VNQELTSQLYSGIAPLLKAHGFSKRGNQFQRAVRDTFHLIQLQKSQSSSADSIRATVNLAVSVNAIASAPPSVIDAHVRCRIGSVMPETADVWWELSSTESAADIVRQVTDALERFGLPWLDSFQSSREVITTWQQGISPGLTDSQRQKFLGKLVLI